MSIEKNIQWGIICQTEDEFSPFGKQLFYFKEIIATAPFAEAIVFIDPMEWTGNDVTWTYQWCNNSWSKKLLPIPKILLNRFTPKKQGAEAAYNLLIDYLKKGDYHFCIPLKLQELLKDKLAFHQFLEAYDIIQIPTKPLLSLNLEQLKAFTKQHINCYLKPSKGSNGKGIYQLKQLDRNSFQLGQTLFKNTKSLYQYLQKDLFRDYIIQAEVASIPFKKDCVFDIRVLLQALDKNYPKISAYGIRSGKENSPISNLHAGGNAFEIEELRPYIEEHCELSYEDYLLKMEEDCYKIASTLHNVYGSYYEIAFDILCTKKGPVILEANSKPARWIFQMLADRYLDKAKYFTKIREASVKSIHFYTKNLNLGNSSKDLGA